jgi:hypothetical protein
MRPLADMLIKKAKSGDLRALQVLLDRAWGRPSQEVRLTATATPLSPSPRILELARKLNG